MARSIILSFAGHAPEHTPRLPGDAHDSPATTFARHIGRVGALAIALGVGLAVTTSHGAGLARAEAPERSRASESGSASSSADTDTDTGSDATDDDEATPDDDAESSTSERSRSRRAESDDDDIAEQEHDETFSDTSSEDSPSLSATTHDDTSADRVEDAQPSTTAVVPAPAPIVRQPATPVEALLGSPVQLVRIAVEAIDMLVHHEPTTPTDPPVLLAVLAFARREIQRTFFNSSPDAVADAAVATEDIPKTIDVLGNDTDADLDAGDVLTITDHTQAAHGTVVLNRDGTFIYTPNENFSGTDTFTYTISDDASRWHIGSPANLFAPESARTATVTITVAAVNDAPAAVDDSVTTVEGGGAVTGNVLGNDTDPDAGDTLVVTDAGTRIGTKGVLELHTDGSYTYTPDIDAAGTETFAYTVADESGGTDSGTVTIAIAPLPSITVPEGSVRDVTTGPDGTLVVRTRTGAGTADDPYRTTVAVLRPGQSTPITVTTDGTDIVFSPSQVTADGTVVSTTRTGTGTAAGPYLVTMTVLRPGSDTPIVTTVEGPSTSVNTAADGTVLLVSRAGNGSTVPFRTTITVLRPGTATPVTVAVDGTPSARHLTDEGTVAVVTRAGTAVTTTVVRPGSTTPVSVTTDGAFMASDVSSNGTVVVSTQSASDAHRTTMTVLRPDSTTPVTVTADGAHTTVFTAADGTAALVVATGTGAADDPQRATLIVLRPDATTPIYVTLDGELGGLGVNDSGSLMFAAVTRPGTDTGYRTSVAALHPGAVPAIYITDGSIRSTRLLPDGTVVLVTGAGTTFSDYRTTITVLDPDTGAPTAVTVDGIPESTNVADDGTVALATRTGTGSAEDPFRTTAVLLRPDATNPVTATADGRVVTNVSPEGAVVVTAPSDTGTAVAVLRPGAAGPVVVVNTAGTVHSTKFTADGTVVLITQAGSGDADDPVLTTVTVLRPDAGAPVTAVDGAGGRLRVFDDGTVALTAPSGAGTAVTILNPGATAPVTTSVPGEDYSLTPVTGGIRVVTRTSDGTDVTFKTKVV